MTDFRPGDIVTIELEVAHHKGWTVLAVEGTNFDKFPGPWSISAQVLGMLEGAGKVTLVRRAEPDWQPGDIAQHVDTGELFSYHPTTVAGDDRAWRRISTFKAWDAANWLSEQELAGKLVRCTVTPEVTS